MITIKELRPYLGDIIHSLNQISESGGGASSLDPTASTSAVQNPRTLTAGYSNLVVTKTNASGTVTITFPNASTYVMSADGEVFVITGSLLGAFTIAAASGATFKYYAY